MLCSVGITGKPDLLWREMQEQWIWIWERDEGSGLGGRMLEEPEVREAVVGMYGKIE